MDEVLRKKMKYYVQKHWEGGKLFDVLEAVQQIQSIEKGPGRLISKEKSKKDLDTMQCTDVLWIDNSEVKRLREKLNIMLR